MNHPRGDGSEMSLTTSATGSSPLLRLPRTRSDPIDALESFAGQVVMLETHTSGQFSNRSTGKAGPSAVTALSYVHCACLGTSVSRMRFRVLHSEYYSSSHDLLAQQRV